MKKKNLLKIAIFSLFFAFSFQAQVINDNFEDGDLTGWTEGVSGDWINSTSTPITGTRSLKHNLSVAGESYIYHDISSLDLTTQNISWQFNLKNSGFDPSGNNKFWVYLTANETNLNGATVDGYAVGVNFTGTSDLITLWKVTNGAADGAVISSSIDWGTTDLIGIKITRSSTGLWELIIDNDENGDFDNLTSQGTATNTDYTFDDYFGLSFTFTSSNAGDLRMDDVTVEGTTPSTDTTLSFNSATSTVSEDGTSIDICVGITNPDASSATTVEIALNGGSTTASNPGDYTPSSAFTTTLTFPANSSTDQCITINLTNDGDSESNEVLVLDLQNAAGGNSATLGTTTQHTLTITDDDLPNIIINEILADPGAVVDANGDGTVDSGDDEFVELVNLDITSLDLTGYTISDAGSVRYTFGSVTIPAGGSVVIFGGGTPTGISGFADTAGTLSLNNGGDTVTLTNPGATTIATYTYGSEADDDQSIGRNDDLTGAFVKHSTISSNPVNASPGRYNSSNLPFSTLTWTGATDNAWTTGSNWSTGTAPIASDDVQILKTSNQPTVSTAVTVNSATINSGATLIATNTFTGNVTYNRTLANAGQWYYMSSPVIDENYNNTWVTDNSIPSSTQDVDNRGISWYDNSSSDTDSDGASTADSATGFWRYMEEGTSTPFAVGRGYGIIRSGAGNVSFTGAGIYTSDQTFLLTQGVNNFNLIGNPFTAFVTLGTFYTANSANIDTDFYFWNGSSYTTITSGADPTYEIAPGQGFFVEATSAANVTFEIADASHQSTDTFQKTANTRPEINVTAKEDTKESFARFLYIDGTTKGYDKGYDGKLFGGVSHSFVIYSDLIESDGKKYQSQSLPNLDYENMVIPIGVIVEANKEISFSAEALNLPADINVYLEDRLTNTFTRLDEANSSYKISSDVALDGIGRFYLHTKNSSSLSVDTVNMDNISIYKTTNSNLRIAGISQGKASIKLYSILGKQVFEDSFTSNGVQNITIPALSSGIYIVQLETETGSLNKKITLE